MNIILAIILDGRHGGMRTHLPYSPKIKLPTQYEYQISIGEDYDKSVRVGDEITYYECFRSVDRTTVLYSTTGKATDFRVTETFLRPTYPISLGF